MEQRTNIYLSLEEIIRIKRTEAASNFVESATLSLKDYISGLVEEGDSVYLKLYDYDKSLDEIIDERGTDYEPPVTSEKKRVHWDQSVQGEGCKKHDVPNVLLKPVDPCTTALDDMMEKVVDVKHSEVKVSDWIEHTHKRKHQAMNESESSARFTNDSNKNKEIRQRQFNNFTPYRAVGFLSEKGMIIEIEIGKLSKDTDVAIGRSHLWRCVVKCGEIKGTADSVRKVVAREMACKNFLIQLGEVYQGISIPKYYVLDELFIDPRLFNRLEKEVMGRALNISHEVRAKRVNPEDELCTKRYIYYTYICTYVVGVEKFHGEHYIIEYAKLLAARAAYGFITGKEPRPTKYFIGKECDVALQYDFNESETFQTLSKIKDEELDSMGNLKNQDMN